jgi:SAM-dependent methyltransferase
MSNHFFDTSASDPINPPMAADCQAITLATEQIYRGLLDDIARRLSDSDDQQIANQAMDELCVALQARKVNSSATEWKEFVTRARQHPVMQLIHQDPFTFRAFSKPRGYAGDAEMMDFIYGREDGWDRPAAEPVGQRVFEYTTLSAASEGVRARRAFVAAAIDRLAEERSRPHILSIAAGHLREASLSAAVRRRRTGRFVALDADALSAQEVRDCYAPYGVETVTASFRRLLSRSGGAGEFDLVYSTGLFDYLNERTGRRLVAAMFRMLRPGGSLLVANFLPDVRDIGYMETCMDWNLIYRSRRDMIELTTLIPESEIKKIEITSEECKNIIFLQLKRT